MGEREKLDYRAAGVDIKAVESFIEKLKPIARATFGPGVIGDIGGFSGLFRLGADLRDPVIVATTDGVGTKLKLAFMSGVHGTVGVDLVAMCVNDLTVVGARPLFLLDYMAAGALDENVALEVVKGIARGCSEVGCALLGGETAQMPGFYAPGEYDLAGFAVGVVERDKIVDGRRVRPGDQLVGLASSGLHSNGYSLARKIVFELAGLKFGDHVEKIGRAIGEALLEPTRIYSKAALKLSSIFDVKAMAHITGGSFQGNLPRVLPDNCSALLRRGSWPVPQIFEFLREAGAVAIEEMYETFNMGIGFVLIVEKGQEQELMAEAGRLGEAAYLIGEVIERGGQGEMFLLG